MFSLKENGIAVQSKQTVGLTAAAAAPLWLGKYYLFYFFLM